RRRDELSGHRGCQPAPLAAAVGSLRHAPAPPDRPAAGAPAMVGSCHPVGGLVAGAGRSAAVLRFARGTDLHAAGCAWRSAEPYSADGLSRRPARQRSAPAGVRRGFPVLPSRPWKRPRKHGPWAGAPPERPPPPPSSIASSASGWSSLRSSSTCSAHGASTPATATSSI